MHSVQSKDGTRIAFARFGEGPPVILVDGALCYREVGWSVRLAKRLAEQFTVFTYDRRGRGESGDTQPYAAEREIEDLQALIDEAGGAASLFGVSSGGALGLEAAARGSGVRKLVLYEVPFVIDDSQKPTVQDYPAHLETLLAADRRSDAVKLFLRQVGLPGAVIATMRFLPIWSKLTAIAHTLPYDSAILSVAESGKLLPAERWAAVTVPALTVVGGKSPEWFHNSMQALAQALPNAEFRVLDGQTHNVKPKHHAQLLTEFFTADRQVTAADRARRFASEVS